MKKHIKNRLKELEMQVSQFDKVYNDGIRTQLHLGDPKIEYVVTLSNYEVYLIDLLCNLNGVDSRNYIFVTEYGVICGDEFKLNRDFKEMSSLSMADDIPDSIDSLEFKGRFISYIIYDILEDLHGLIKSVYKNGIVDQKKKRKYGNYLIILNETIKTLNMVIITYLSKDGYYTEHLGRLMELRILSDGSPKKKKYTKLFNRKVEFIRDICQKNLIGMYNEDQFIILNDITKMAYMLATERYNFKNCGLVPEDIKISDKKSVKEVLGRLGYAIMVDRSKHKANPIYKAYLKAKPEIYSSMKIRVDNVELGIAIQALTYEKLVLDNTGVSSVIDKVICG